MRHGKAYQSQSEKFDHQKLMAPKEAIKQLKEVTFAKFDESVEVHFNLGIDPKQADQQLRGTLVLPHGTGKQVKIAVVTNADKAKSLVGSGADEIGSEELIAKIESGWIGFDILIASPDMMAKLAKLGRILGSKGLMPSPKNGTVTQDIATAVKEFKAGKVEYRNDKGGLLHVVIGRKSFSDDQVYENFMTLYETILKVKPSKSKGVYLKTLTICTTMSPGIKIEPMKTKWKE